MMLTLAAAAAEKSAFKGLLGAFHPGVVHFPIALLGVAAFLEVVQFLRKRGELAPATPALVYLAAATAVPASFFGFMLADVEGAEGSLIDLHKWLGLGSTVVSLVAAGLVFKAKSGGGLLLGLRLALVLGAGLVLSAGYIGGELVFGEGHLTRWVRILLGIAPPPPKDPPVTNTAKTGDQKPLLSPDRVSFEREIAPIIKDMCFKCHGGEKVKGKFNLSTKKTAFDQAESGKAILPGKPTLSSFYTSLNEDPESDKYMPPVKEKVRPSKDQAELIRKWIEQGAEWPDGFEFKK